MNDDKYLTRKTSNPTQQSVCLTMPVDFDCVAASEKTIHSFNESLKMQIGRTLDILPDQVQVCAYIEYKIYYMVLASRSVTILSNLPISVNLCIIIII